MWGMMTPSPNQLKAHPMRNIKIGTLCFTLIWALVITWVSSTEAVVLDTSAELTTGAQVTQVDPLSFGKFTVGPAGGSIKISPRSGGQTLTTGDISLLGNLEQRGVVNVMAPKGANVMVTVGDTILTDPVSGQSMTVSNVSCVEKGNPTIGSCDFKMKPLGNADVGVGGTLTVVPNQQPGLYQGFIVVTANFQ